MIDSDYTFLNERLAKHYGIHGVKGDEMRRVTLPPGSPRGGVLTQGTVLAVTSNPDRTSPVKRGLFILDNILGIAAGAAAAEYPAARRRRQGGSPARCRPCARRWLLHRSQPSCSSCHARMDPLGLGSGKLQCARAWRDKERGQPVDASGKLITGESFTDVQRAEADPGQPSTGATSIAV